MLESAGLEFEIEKSSFDEEAAKEQLAGLSIKDKCLELARGKGHPVSEAQSQALVISSDQICSLGDDIFDKPSSAEKNIENLKKLAGKTHRQNNATIVFLGGEIVCELFEYTDLTMRDLSDAQIEAYVAAEQPFNAAGGYQFESLGKNLFAKVEGSHDIILGLNLMGLLNFLHEQNYVQFK